MTLPSQDLMQRAALYQVIADLRAALEDVLESTDRSLKYTDEQRLTEIAEVAQKALDGTTSDVIENMDAANALALESLSYDLDRGWPGLKEGELAERGTAAFIFGQIALAVADDYRYSVREAIRQCAGQTEAIMEKALDDFAKTLEINKPD
jgi:hypothetical protein